jgi:hypothetical protein
MTLDAAVGELGRCFDTLVWEHPVFSIFTLPCFLGRALSGDVEETPFSQWVREWLYRDRSMFEHDLKILLSEVRKVFSAVSDREDTSTPAPGTNGAFTDAGGLRS